MSSRTLIAIVLAFLVAAGAGASGGGGTAGTAVRVQASSSGNATARDRDTGRIVRRLQQKGLRVEQRAVSADGDCAAHSYGQVTGFFRRHPCTALFRALFEVRDSQGDVVLVAVAWVDMPDPAVAREFQALVDIPGTGNLVELSREVRFTGKHYRSVRDDTTVVNAQAEPVAGGAVTLATLVAETAVSS